MKALQDCVIIERDTEKHSFLTLPSEKLGTGVAIAIGPKCLEIKVGDHVYFDVGQEFVHDKTDYVVMREPHILGILE